MGPRFRGDDTEGARNFRAVTGAEEQTVVYKAEKQPGRNRPIPAVHWLAWRSRLQTFVARVTMQGMSNTSEIVDGLISLDGSERWKLYRQANGLYFASVENLDFNASCAGENRVGFDTDTAQHWVRGRVSGPFDTVEAAQHDALDNLPWFFEALTSDTNGS